ncbi:MAG: purine-nucleoside phosphorylase [Pseudomonadota bacterium]
MSTEIQEEVQKAAAFVVRAIAPRLPKIGVVLGSGLGQFADALEDPIALSYGNIPGFAETRVEGHLGRLVGGYCAGTPVFAMQGRIHFYEGHPMSQVVLPIRTMIAAGCKILVITNAAGGIGADLEIGDLVLISDHINLTGQNPLIGENNESLGPRFPDMSAAYDPELRAIAYQQATAEGLRLKEGVYCGLLGPSYETPAEIRTLRTIGADLVGMSTVCEVIAAVHMGARVLGISCVTNKAAGLGEKLSHEDVKKTGAKVSASLIALISRIVAALGEI